MSESENDKIVNKKNSKLKIINFILIVIIIILLLSTYSCMRFEKINDLVPTGNYDVFNIVIGKCKNHSCGCNDNPCKCENNTCKCETDESNYAGNSSITEVISRTENEKEENKIEIIPENKTEIKPENKTEIETEEEPKVGAFISDDDGLYQNSNKLNIFSNPYYEFKNIIAPESTNTYKFLVKNVNDFNIKYNLKMIEENEYNINIKYRMKMNNNYVAGNENEWVTCEELQLKDIKLSANSNDVYELEWKWFESDNDTYIGSIDADYALKISFDGQEIE